MSITLEELLKKAEKKFEEKWKKEELEEIRKEAFLAGVKWTEEYLEKEGKKV